MTRPLLRPMMCNHAGMKPGATYDYSDAKDDGYQFSLRGEDGFMRWKLAQAVAFIRSAPAGFAVRSLKRLLDFWLSPYPLIYGPLLVLRVLGAFSAGEIRFFVFVMLSLCPLAFYATETAWAVSYRHPLEPLVLLCASHGGLRLKQTMERRASILLPQPH